MFDSGRFLGPALVFLGLVGVLIGAAATVDSVSTYHTLRARGVVADATVTQVLHREHNEASGPSSTVMVEFMTPSGPVKEAMAVEGVEVGAHLQVTYDRENPVVVSLGGLQDSPDLWPWVPLMLFGLVVAMIGMARVWTMLRRRTPPAAVP